MAENEGAAVRKIIDTKHIVTRDDKEREYATQFFDFIPSSFVDEMSEDALELVTGALQAMKTNIEKKQAGKYDQEQLDKGFETVKEKFSSNTEKVLEKLGSFVGARILRIPSHVLLPENSAWEGQSKAKVEKNLASVNCDMVTLKSNIRKGLYMKEVLSVELNNLQKVCKYQEEIIEDDDKMFQAVKLEDTRDIVEFIGITERDTAKKKEELLENMMGLVDSKRPTDNNDSIIDSRKKKLKISKVLNQNHDI